MIIALFLIFPCFPPTNVCFLCALCGNVTTFFYFSLKYTVQKSFWNKQLCPEFINVMIENVPSHKYGAKSRLCNVVMKGSQILSHIFIHTLPFGSLCRDERP